MSRSSRDESIWAGYADLATGTMVVFLLLLAALTAAMKARQEVQATEVQLQAEKVKKLTHEIQVILGTRKRLADALREAVADADRVDPVTAQMVVVEGAETIQFAEGQAVLTDRSKAWLREFVPSYVCALWQQDRKNCLNGGADPATCTRLDPERPQGVRRVLVTGHADLKGNSVANLDLSARRGHAVVEYIIARLKVLDAADQAGGNPAVPDACRGDVRELRGYVEKRFVAVGSGDMEHCRAVARSRPGGGGPLCAASDVAEPGYRRVTFELELTGSDMTGLVLDLLALQAATGQILSGDDDAEEEATDKAQGEQDRADVVAATLPSLRDEIADGCFIDPGRYHGCSRYIDDYLKQCTEKGGAAGPLRTHSSLDCDAVAPAWDEPTLALREAVCKRGDAPASFACPENP